MKRSVSSGGFPHPMVRLCICWASWRSNARFAAVMWLRQDTARVPPQRSLPDARRRRVQQTYVQSLTTHV